MRKLIIKVSAAAMIAAGAVTALQAGASAAPIPHSDDGAAAAAQAGGRQSDPSLSFTTTMTSYTPVGFTSGAPAAGDGYVIAGQVTRHGVRDGLSTAQCTFRRQSASPPSGCGLYHTGGDRVDPHAVRAVLRGPGPRQGLQRALGGAIERADRDAQPRDPGAQVDDRPAADRHHDRGDRRGQEERRLHVYRVDAVESLLVGGRGAVTGVDAGVVDQYVDAPAQEGRRLPGERREAAALPSSSAITKSARPPRERMPSTTCAPRWALRPVF
jgi:hypothetical protein